MKKISDGMTLNDDADYVAAAEKLTNLKNRLSKFQTEEPMLLEQVRGVNSQGQDRGESVLEKQASALLAGKDVSVSPDLASLSKQLNGLRTKMKVLAKAIEIQTIKLQAEKGRVSAEFCKKLMPQHKENNRNVLRSILSAYHCQASERELRFGLEVRGIVAGQLIGMPDFIQFGRMGDVQSRIRMIVRGYFDRGFITEEELKKIIDGKNI